MQQIRRNTIEPRPFATPHELHTPLRMKDRGNYSVFLSMRLHFFLLLLLTHFAHTSFAGGGNENIIARMNGWTVTMGSGGDSISKSTGKEQYHANIEGAAFWDYYLVFRTLPRMGKGQKSDFKIIESDSAGRETVLFVRPEYARPLMEVMLLNFRAQLRSFEPEMVQAELNARPPLGKKLRPNGNFEFIVKPG
jgi:hypothetical protein